VYDFLSGAEGRIGWDQINTAGSDLTDIATRNHNDLQSFNGGTSGEYYHLTSAQHGNVVDLLTGIDWNTGTSTLDVTGDVDISGNLERGGTQVVTARQTGWGAPTGTATRTTYATFAGQTISDPPTQTEVQNIDDHVVILSERLHALIDDLTTHGLIGT
jgi:hypothetical protein